MREESLVLARICSVLVRKSSIARVYRSRPLFLGNHLGEVLVFNIPPKGSSITLKETITGRQADVLRS